MVLPPPRGNLKKDRCFVMLDQNNYSDSKISKEQNNKKSAPPPTSHPVQTKPVRRIGTMTMGLTLVIVGVLLLIYFFHPFDLLWIIRFSPVLLIVLGVEILWQYFANRGQNLRYDFLGTFFCLMIICAGLGASSLYPLFLKYGNNWRLEEMADSQIYDQLYEDLSDLPILSLEVNTSLVSVTPETQSFTIDHLSDADHVGLYITLKETENQQTFAAQVRTLLDRLEGYDYPNLSVVVDADYPGGEYTLSLYDRFMQKLSAQELAQYISVDDYGDEEEYPQEAIEQTEQMTVGESV